MRFLAFVYRLVARLFFVTLALASMLLIPEPLGRADIRSPGNRVLVVTANLLEGYDEADLQDMSEINVVADRLLELAPYYPDVILVQEVRSQSARYLAEVLEDLSGADYDVASDAGFDPWEQKRHTVVRRETAVIVNSDTMAIVDAGYIPTVVARGDSVFPNRTTVHRNAFSLLRERDSGLAVAAVSVHFPLNRAFVDEDAALDYKRRWSAKLAGVLDGRAPEALHVIGGDFNSIRCDGNLGRRSVCEPRPFWSALDERGYVDTQAWIHPKSKAVDYLFADRHVVDAAGDMDYDKAVGPTFYSDHRFRWALLDGDPVQGPPPRLYDGRK